MCAPITVVLSNVHSNYSSDVMLSRLLYTVVIFFSCRHTSNEDNNSSLLLYFILFYKILTDRQTYRVTYTSLLLRLKICWTLDVRKIQPSSTIWSCQKLSWIRIYENKPQDIFSNYQSHQTLPHAYLFYKNLICQSRILSTQMRFFLLGWIWSWGSKKGSHVVIKQIWDFFKNDGRTDIWSDGHTDIVTYTIRFV